MIYGNSISFHRISRFTIWKKSGNIIVLKRIRQLLEAIQKNPFSGIGKPESLKHNWASKWSRRINQEHRLIYKVENNVITVYSLGNGAKNSW